MIRSGWRSTHAAIASLTRRSSSNASGGSAQAVPWITVDDERTSMSMPRRSMSARCRPGSTILRKTSSMTDIGAFTMPLQDLDLALAELQRCVEQLRMRVVNLPVAVRGTYLSAPPFHSLWEEIARRELVALVHPDGATDRGTSSTRCGTPSDSQWKKRVPRVLDLRGVLERWPDLKIVVSHGGGYLPRYFGRWIATCACIRPARSTSASR